MSNFVFSNRCLCSDPIHLEAEETFADEERRLWTEIQTAKAELPVEAESSSSVTKSNPKAKQAKNFFPSCACSSDLPAEMGTDNRKAEDQIRILRRALAETLTTTGKAEQIAERVFRRSLKKSADQKASLQQQGKTKPLHKFTWSGGREAQAVWSNGKWYDVLVGEVGHDGTLDCFFVGSETYSNIPPSRLRDRPAVTSVVGESAADDNQQKSSHTDAQKKKRGRNESSGSQQGAGAGASSDLPPSKGATKSDLPSTLEPIVVPRKLLDFVEKHMKTYNCGAHDMTHVYRVSNLARKIAAVEGADQTLAYVAGLVHDILDSKLVDSDTATEAELALLEILNNDMQSDLPFWGPIHTDHVMEICRTVGYKNLLKVGWNPTARSAEYKCVQDADLLDAIGNVGIARCFAFGGKRSRQLFGVAHAIGESITAEQYAVQSQKQGSGAEHFFDKLLLIKDMMCTKTGKLMAEPRHARLLEFLQGLETELVEGSDGTSQRSDMRGILDHFLEKGKGKEKEPREKRGKK